MKKYFFIIICLTIAVNAFSQQNMHYAINELTSGTGTNLRGLSVVDDNILWVSGSKGWTGKSNDAGKTWKWQQPKGFEKLDFRDIEAFDENNAIIMNAGSPAYIMKTNDGGNNWKIVYENKDSLAFIDGMDFWDEKRGMAYGDPVNGRFLILTTNDGGENWETLPFQQAPEAFTGEASFAASGTAIRTLKGGYAWIGTGGSHSRLLFSSGYGLHWKSFDCPVIQGEASQGIFSLVFTDEKNGIIVGGDYSRDTLRTKNCFITTDGGNSWKSPEVNPFGYRSGLEALGKKVLIATGTSGTDISNNSGHSWMNLDKQSYNTVRKAKNGKAVYIAGSQGKVGRIILGDISR